MFTLHHIQTNITEPPYYKCKRDENYFETFLFVYFFSDVLFLTDEEYRNFPPGSLVLFEPNAPQYWKTENWSLNHSYFDFSAEERNYIDEFDIPYNVPLFPRSAKKLTEIIRQMQEIFHAADYLAAKKLDALLINLLTELSDSIHKHTSESAVFSKELKQKFDEARISMYENPQKYDCTEYYRLLGFSPTRANFYYRRFYSTTPLKDINEARKQKTIRMIGRGTKLSELCAALGFENELYVSRWLKKNFGMTFTQLKNNDPSPSNLGIQP